MGILISFTQFLNFNVHAYIVQFVVKTAGIADRLSVMISPPQRRVCRLAVGADRPLTSG
jgi:hypothetical protein